MKVGNILFGISLGAGAILAFQYARELLNAFRFKVIGYGLPLFHDWILTLPITVQFNNPTSLTINAENVLVDVYLKNSSGAFIHVGRISQPISLPPGKSEQTIIPVMNLETATGLLINSWRDLLARHSVTIRTDVTVTYRGITLPTQQYEDVIKI